MHYAVSLHMPICASSIPVFRVNYADNFNKILNLSPL